MNNETRKTAMDAAIWVTASPHEWQWTHEQQVAMARFCCWASLTLDNHRRLVEEYACTIQQNSVEGMMPFVVVDVDGVIIARGHTVDEAANNAIAELEPEQPNN